MSAYVNALLEELGGKKREYRFCFVCVDWSRGIHRHGYSVNFERGLSLVRICVTDLWLRVLKRDGADLSDPSGRMGYIYFACPE